jgi:hypothetical protein
MWRKRSTRETDAPPERDQGTQDVVLGPAVQGALVEVVDVALDHLDDLEIPDEDLVHQCRQQVGGIQRTQAGFAIQAIDIALQGADGAGMYGDYEVLPRDQIDLATGQAAGVVFRWLEGLKGEVQPILGPPRVCTTILLSEPFPFRLGELQASRQLGEGFVVISTIDVDPQQLSVAELRYIEVGEIDPPIVAVGIEQPGGDGAQLTKLSR